MCSKIMTEVGLNNLLANFYVLASTCLMAYLYRFKFRHGSCIGWPQNGWIWSETIGRDKSEQQEGSTHFHRAPRRMMYCLHFFWRMISPLIHPASLHSSLLYFSPTHFLGDNAGIRRMGISSLLVKIFGASDALLDSASGRFFTP